MSPWTDRLGLVLAGFKALCALLISIPLAPFRGEKGAATFKLHVIFRASRTFNRAVTVKQFQSLFPPTLQAYEDFVAKNKLPSEVVSLDESAHGLWLGDKSARTVIFWLHGGGYAGPATAGHFQIMHDMMLRFGSENSLSCFILKYDLSPVKSYPGQLQQAVAGFQYLTQTEKISPAQIILIGDSAGGNLALSLLSHLSHQHPALQSTTPTASLRSLVLISPWVTFEQTSKSMETCADKDILDKTVLRTWSDMHLNGAEPDNFNSPLRADPPWWKNIPVGDILVLGGGDEIFIDDIVAFTKKLEVHHREKVHLVVGEGEAHDQPILDQMLGGEPSKQTKELFGWIKARV